MSSRCCEARCSIPPGYPRIPGRGSYKRGSWEGKSGVSTGVGQNVVTSAEARRGQAGHGVGRRRGQGLLAAIQGAVILRAVHSPTEGTGIAGLQFRKPQGLWRDPSEQRGLIRPDRSDRAEGTMASHYCQG